MTIAPLPLWLSCENRVEFEPFVGRGAAALAHGVGWLERVVDENHVRPPPGQHAADRGRHPEASLGRRELPVGRPGRGKPRRKQRAVPGRRHHRPAVAGELVGKLPPVGDVDNAQGRVAAEQPGRQRDRNGERFQVPGRDVDDQPERPAAARLGELCRQRLDMPGGRIGAAAVKLVVRAHQERIEVAPEQAAIFGGIERGQRSNDSVRAGARGLRPGLRRIPLASFVPPSCPLCSIFNTKDTKVAGRSPRGLAGTIRRSTPPIVTALLTAMTRGCGGRGPRSLPHRIPRAVRRRRAEAGARGRRGDRESASSSAPRPWRRDWRVASPRPRAW